ncbi:MAG TPA: nucleotidyltransferase family protein [Gammaproteobacteria bacterium]|nr:nucleotidyltransferase family protein [Gammaproteobacteria bacterium]
MRAMILAAGRGSRLKPLTDTCPKPLVPVANKPLIVYHLETLYTMGVREVVINVSYLREKIIQFLGNGNTFGLTIEYSIEEYALETGGGIYNALPLLGSNPFLLVSSDIFMDYSGVNFPILDVKLAHLFLVPNPSHNAKGDFGLKQGEVVRKRSQDKSYTYANLALLKPALFQYCQSEAFPLVAVILQAIMHQGVSGELFQGHWSDVGTLESLQKLEDNINQQFVCA